MSTNNQEENSMTRGYRSRLFFACFLTGTLVSLFIGGFDFLVQKTMSANTRAQHLTTSTEMNAKLADLTMKLESVKAESNTNIVAIIAERDSFRDKYLREYDMRKALKVQFDKATKVVDRIKHQYKVSSKEILDIQLCTCPKGQPCWESKPCDFPSCPVCAAKKQAEDKKK